MHEALTTYFGGEKNAGLLVAGIGLLTIAAAAVLFPERWGLRSFAITLAVGGILELAVGVGLYLKTGPQVAALARQLTTDPSAFHAAERARMAIVQRNFVYLQIAWLVLIAGSAGVAVWKKHHTTVSGIALGLLVTAAVILVFDVVAERRGAAYLAALQDATPASSGPTPAPATAAPSAPPPSTGG